MTTKLEPIKPGEILLAEFLEPMGVSQNQIARAIKVPPGRINEIVHGKRSITPDTAARFALFFGTSPDLWINLQARYDAKIARAQLMPGLKQIISHHPSSAA